MSELFKGRQPAPLGPELRLIGRILSSDWSQNARREWPSALFEGIDWDAFAAFAWQHKVRPMAVSMLHDAGWPGVPAALRESLESDAGTCVLKSIRQLEAQSLLAEVAESAGVRFVALKGLALSTHLYGDPLIRESFDFDLLVGPGDTQRMKELLRGIGFEPARAKPPLTPRQNAILARFFHEEKFINRSTGVVVDVHHALSANPRRMGASFEDVWKNCRKVRLGRGQLSIPGDADLIWYLSAHAASHAWERWKWVGDLLTLYRRSGTGGLLELRRAAQDAGWAELFDSSLLLASAVTGWESPAALSKLCTGNRSAGRLARRSLRFSARPVTRAEMRGGAYAVRLAMFHLQLGRRPQYVAHELAALLHRPSDWYELQLADPLIPAYYLLRPILFVGRKISRLARGRDGRGED